MLAYVFKDDLELMTLLPLLSGSLLGSHTPLCLVYGVLEVKLGLVRGRQALYQLRRNIPTPVFVVVVVDMCFYGCVSKDRYYGCLRPWSPEN